MKILVINSIILFGLTITNVAYSQTLDFKKISDAMQTKDLTTIVSYAPDKEFGTIQYSTPEQPMQSINKDEFKEIIANFFADNNYEYEQLYNEKVNHLPLIVGKLLTDNKKRYVMMGLADFGGSYKLLMFQFLDELPDNMNA